MEKLTVIRTGAKGGEDGDVFEGDSVGFKVIDAALHVRVRKAAEVTEACFPPHGWLRVIRIANT